MEGKHDENKLKAKNSKEDDCPIRPIVCVKNPVNLKSVEETEDCFILDFDPSDLIDFSNLSLSKNSGVEDDACELTVIAEKGQVAARDCPNRSIVCVKNPVNLKSVEETEDCFILDFDPSDLIDFSKLSLSTNSGVDDDACELTVIAEKGQVAARDYPHSRHLCVRFPFDSTPHKSYCNRKLHVDSGHFMYWHIAMLQTRVMNGSIEGTCTRNRFLRKGNWDNCLPLALQLLHLVAFLFFFLDLNLMTYCMKIEGMI